jgi:SAM-dependent methyltransferase
MSPTVDERYEEFYRAGGWRYDLNAEYLFLVYRILQPLRLRRGSRLLDLGCGTGAHATLFARLGFQVTGIDISPAGIEQATAVDSGATFLCRDAHEYLAELEEASMDVIFARSMSWFHYELGPGTNRFGVDVQAETDRIMQVLRPGGTFVLQVQTNYSGKHPETGNHNHTWYDLMSLMEPRGTLMLFTDWSGLPLIDAQRARSSRNNALMGLRRER